MDNLTYLFWAHAIFVAVLFVYLYSLARKMENLGKEIDSLKESSHTSPPTE